MPQSTLTENLLAHAAREPEKVFCRLIRPNLTVPITYQGLAVRGLQYARAYLNAGLLPGDMVLVALNHGEDMIYAFVGAILGGFIPTYMATLKTRQDPSHYAAQFKIQCQRIHKGLFVTDPETASSVQHLLVGSNLQLLAIDSSISTLPVAAPFYQQPDSIMLLQHSSGTTGHRKGVALSHRAILNQVTRYAATLGLSAEDTIVSWLPLYHDMGLITGFLLPLITGTPLVLLDPFDWVARPWTLWTAITHYRGTLTWLPNFAFHFLARAGVPKGVEIDLSSMRAFINCSEPCKPDAFNVFLQRFSQYGIERSKLHICYAMAEMVFAVTQTPLQKEVEPLQASCIGLEEGQIRKPAGTHDSTYLMPVGIPLSGAQIRILDTVGDIVDDGTVGEIALSAPYMFSGYYKDDPLTAKTIRSGFYHTGDLGVRYQGNYYVTGRIKDLIIVNGRNFYAHDIEAIVNLVEGIKPGRCVAFGIYQPTIGSEVAHVIAESDSSEGVYPSIALDIKKAIQTQMDLVVGKVQIVPHKWLIKTTSGKISRAENRNRYLEYIQTGIPFFN